jgi:hypothetical protein
MSVSDKRSEAAQGEASESASGQDGRVVSWEVEFEPFRPSVDQTRRLQKRRTMITKQGVRKPD